MSVKLVESFGTGIALRGCDLKDHAANAWSTRAVKRIVAMSENVGQGISRVPGLSATYH